MKTRMPPGSAQTNIAMTRELRGKIREMGGPDVVRAALDALDALDARAVRQHSRDAVVRYSVRLSPRQRIALVRAGAKNLRAELEAMYAKR